MLPDIPTEEEWDLIAAGLDALGKQMVERAQSRIITDIILKETKKSETELGRELTDSEAFNIGFDTKGLMNKAQEEVRGKIEGCILVAAKIIKMKRWFATLRDQKDIDSFLSSL